MRFNICGVAGVVVVGVLLIATCVVADVPLVQQPPLSVNSATQLVVDYLGREVFIHGANVVVKGPPWIPKTDAFDARTSFAPQDMAMMQQLGLNGIRLGTMWPAIEPVRGQYNTTFLAQLAALVGNASEYGIFSLLDMHQDVLSEKFCGEGVPAWAAQPDPDDFPFPWRAPYNVSNSTGFPSWQECSELAWMDGYFTPAVGSAFEAIYTNKNGLLDSFAGVWQQIATQMRSLGAAVFGYELLNEPWAGNVFREPSLILPGVADKKMLSGAWNAAAAAIRAVDPTHIVAFEGVTWDWFSVGFDAVPGGASFANQSVLSYHYYDPPDIFDYKTQFHARRADMQRLGCGGMLTEFAIGACSGCGTVETVDVMDECDAQKQSWLFWELKPFSNNKTGWSDSIWFENGTVNWDVARMLSRTYAQRVAGRTQLMRFDNESKYFILVFETAVDVQSNQTVIYFNRALHYGEGFNISVASSAGPSAASYSLSRARPNEIVVTHSSALPPGTTITVQVFNTDPAIQARRRPGRGDRSNDNLNRRRPSRISQRTQRARDLLDIISPMSKNERRRQ